MKSPREIVDLMMHNDAFSKWMKIEVVTVAEGTSLEQAEVVLQGHKI